MYLFLKKAWSMYFEGFFQLEDNKLGIKEHM